MFFLDFDGVLFDTVREAFAVATISIGLHSSIEDVNFESGAYKTFQKQRYLVTSAWNYKYILDSLDGTANIAEQDIRRCINSASEVDYTEFQYDYFRTRNQLKESFFDQWIDLNEPYDFLYYVKPYMLKYPRLFTIVTTKDKSTVQRLLHLEGFNSNEISIFGRDSYEMYGGKSKIIKKIMMDEQADWAFYVDDSKTHLDSCAEISNLKLLHAGWGYIAPEYERSALSQQTVFEHIKRVIV